MLYKLLARPKDSKEILILGLAAWRISHMVVNEVGPFMVFTKIRKLWGIEHDLDGFPITWPSTVPLSCTWCMSVWVAAVLLFVPKVIVRLFAISGVACLLEERYGKG